MASADFREIIRRNWFLIGILVCILAAEIFPSLGKSGGILRPEWTIKYGAVGLIFFISGLSLSTNDILLATTSYKIHLFIQLFTFIWVPLIILMLNLILKFFGINEWLLKGLTTVSCMPPPVSSAVILTRAVGGNEAAAIFNSVVGSFLGIIITPIILLFFLGSTAVISVVSSVFMLGQTVVLPLLLGLALRHFKAIQNLKKVPLPAMGQFLLLLIIYTTFCDAFVTHDAPMNASDILISVVLVVIVQVFLLYLCFWISASLKCYSPADVIAITFCSTHKSLTLGVPILRILFSGYSHFSQITLPLLIYHPTQIILGGLIVPSLKKWMKMSRSKMKVLP